MKVVTVGDNCLDWYLGSGLVFPGGNALNVAVFMRRLGADASYLGQFGTDRAGDIMLDALRAEGVNTSRVRRAQGNSGYATIELVDGDRVFTGSSSGVVDMSLEGEDYESLEGARVIHSGAHSFMEQELPRLSEIAPVSFDFTTRPESYFAPLLRHVTYAAFSRAHLSIEEIEALIERAHGEGVKEVFVTRGENGSVVSAARQFHVQEAVLTEDVVDTMGAGDAFIAGMLFNRLTGVDLPEAALRASRLAAEACLVQGAIGHGAPDAGMSYAPDHKVVS